MGISNSSLWKLLASGREQGRDDCNSPTVSLTWHAKVLSFYTHSRYLAIELNRVCWILLSLRTPCQAFNNLVMQSFHYLAIFWLPLLHFLCSQKHFAIVCTSRKQSLLTTPGVYSLVLNVLCVPQLRGKHFLEFGHWQSHLSWPLLPHWLGHRLHWVIPLGRCHVQAAAPTQASTRLLTPQSHLPWSQLSASACSGPTAHLDVNESSPPTLPRPLQMAQHVSAFGDHWLHGNLNLQTTFVIHWGKSKVQKRFITIWQLLWVMKGKNISLSSLMCSDPLVVWNICFLCTLKNKLWKIKGSIKWFLAKSEGH